MMRSTSRMDSTACPWLASFLGSVHRRTCTALGRQQHGGGWVVLVLCADIAPHVKPSLVAFQEARSQVSVWLHAPQGMGPFCLPPTVPPYAVVLAQGFRPPHQSHPTDIYGLYRVALFTWPYV